MGEERNIKKRILIATPLYPPEIGGPATYVRMLEEVLPEHDISITVVSYSEVRHLPRGISHLCYLWKLFKNIKGQDIVYGLDPVSVGLPAYIASSFTGKPLWVRLGGDYAWEQGVQRFNLDRTLDEYTLNKKDAAIQVQILANIQSYVVRKARKVIVPSEYMKRIVSTWGANLERLEVIYSAPTFLETKLEKSDYRRKYGLEGTILISIGRLVPWKGFLSLVEVVNKLRKDYPDILLLIAGDGPQRGILHEYIAEHKMSKHVRLLGRVSKNQLGEYITASDAFVLNTAYEGLSHQIIEVMQLGVPVVTTNVGGNPELLTHGENGLLFKYDDVKSCILCIKQVLEKEVDVRTLVSKAKVRTEDFSPQKSTRRLLSLLLRNV